MICKYCNAEIDDGEKICPLCGKSLTDPEELPEQTIPEAGETAETAETCPEAEKTVETAESCAGEAGEVCPEETEQTDAEAPVPEETEQTDAETPAPEETETESEQKKKPATWKIVTAVAVGVLLVAVLTCAVLYGMGVLRPHGEGVLYRDSYTASDETVQQKKDVVVATMGDKELTVTELQSYYWMGAHTYISNNQYYLSAMGLDLTKPLDKQEYGGKEGYTWQQYFLEQALETWKQYAALTMAAEKAGFKLNEEDQAFLDDPEEQFKSVAAEYGYESVDDMIRADMGAGGTMEGYTRYLRNYFTALSYYGEEMDKAYPTQEDIEAYFTENEETLKESGITKDMGNQVDIRHILLKPEGDAYDEEGNFVGYTEEAFAACLTEAQKVYDEWLASDMTEETFAQMAQKYSADGSAEDGGLYTGVTEGQMVPEFNDWIMDTGRKPGDHDLIRTQYGYHIMYFVGSEEIWIYQCRNAIQSERSTELIKSATEAFPMKVNYGKIVLGTAKLDG